MKESELEKVDSTAIHKESSGQIYDSPFYAAEDAAISMMESCARDAQRKRERSLNYFIRAFRQNTRN